MSSALELLSESNTAEFWQNPYSYLSFEPCSNLHIKGVTKKWSHYAVDFPAVHPTDHAKNGIIHGEYFQPLGIDSAPLAILVHGIGDYSVIPCKLLARDLVKNGIACFIPYLMFHSSRLPKALRERMPSLTCEEWFEGHRTSVIDIRRVVDWTRGRAQINQERIAVIGTSFGAYISAITMGIDERVKAGVFVATGGNGEVITWMNRINAIRKGATCTRAECRHIHSHYPNYLDEVADKGFENVIPAKQCFLNDTLTFASYLRKRPVLMFNALWDEVVPRKAAVEFWERCDKPPIVWFPASHVTIWLWYPLISRKIVRFVRSTFGMRDK